MSPEETKQLKADFQEDLDSAIKRRDQIQSEIDAIYRVAENQADRKNVDLKAEAGKIKKLQALIANL